MDSARKCRLGLGFAVGRARDVLPDYPMTPAEMGPGWSELRIQLDARRYSSRAWISPS